MKRLLPGGGPESSRRRRRRRRRSSSHGSVALARRDLDAAAAGPGAGPERAPDAPRAVHGRRLALLRDAQAVFAVLRRGERERRGRGGGGERQMKELDGGGEESKT